MTVREAARALEISPSLVYQLCYSGQLGHTRIGRGRGLIRISQEDIDALKAKGRVEPRDEVERRQREEQTKPGRRVVNGIVIPIPPDELPKHLQPKWLRGAS